MTEVQYFSVSYSRRELYFTEALVLRLQDMGFNIFFDLQQLEPGEDWERTLEYGFTNCQAVIVIVSKASMASPYVQREWQGALDNNIPVICVMFEPVALPQGLMQCPRYDFRQGFNRKIKQLAAHLKGGEPRFDKTPTQYRPYRFKVQRPALLTLLALLVHPLHLILLAIWASYTLYTRYDGLQQAEAPTLRNWVVAFTIFMGFLLFSVNVSIRPGLQFWRREATYSRIRMGMIRHIVYFLPFGIFSAILLLFRDNPNIPLALIVIGMYLYLILMALLIFFGRFPILSWFGVDGGVTLQDLRSRKHKRLIQKISRSGQMLNIEAPTVEDDDGSSVVSRELLQFSKYTMCHVDADVGYANHIRGHLKRHDVEEITAHPPPADVPMLILISDKTTGEDVQAWLTQHQHLRLVFVIITQFDLPLDVQAQMQKYQYFDLRRGVRVSFRTLADYLKGEHISTSLHVNPISLTERLKPIPVIWLRRTLFLSALYLALHAFYLWDVSRAIDNTLVSAGFWVLIGVIVFKLVALLFVGKRRVHQYSLTAAVLIACLALVAYTLPVDTVADTSSTVTGILNIWSNGGGWQFSLGSLLLYAPFIVLLLQNRYWLPR